MLLPIAGGLALIQPVAGTATAPSRGPSVSENLVDLAIAKLSPINAEIKRLVADSAYIDGVLAEGAGRAQMMAAQTMRRVKDIVGLVHR